MTPTTLLAEYGDVTGLRAAARALRGRGYFVEAYTPHPVEGLQDDLALRKSRVPVWGLAGAMAGLLGGFALQVWSMVFSYPFLVAGRPLFSWQAFVPVMFELTILGAALALFAGVFVENRLPMLHHPLFDHAPFSRAAIDRYFLLVCFPAEEHERARSALDEARPLAVTALPLAEGFRP